MTTSSTRQTDYNSKLIVIHAVFFPVFTSACNGSRTPSRPQRHPQRLKVTSATSARRHEHLRRPQLRPTPLRAAAAALRFRLQETNSLVFYLRTSVFEHHFRRATAAQPADRRQRHFYPTCSSISTTFNSNCNVRRRREHRKFPILLFTLEKRHRLHLIEWREDDVVGP